MTDTYREILINKNIQVIYNIFPYTYGNKDNKVNNKNDFNASKRSELKQKIIYIASLANKIYIQIGI